MWHTSNFPLHTDCFSASGLVFNRTIILMREINIRQRPHLTALFLSCVRLFCPAHDSPHRRFATGVKIMGDGTCGV
ncbi:hypothetical protein E2566_04285 [Pectobacterium punjabense]|uniref:Uncharacterized protein n=1 Tax=Pectobacterium punjabense TaxID=2108399 RepID=A0ABX6KYS7_9GAMM|nr:hypothetical protein C9I36_21105 [Pectobacterium punjabense]QJA19205.1 hypothetical protein E2566_04285 [Pectobacterium punjabense]